MIHNNSSDPVLVKKIQLQIWTLRDEIESIISESLTKSPEEVKKTITALRNELSGITAGSEEGPLPDNVLGMPGAESAEEPKEMSQEEALGEFLDAEDDDEGAEDEGEGEGEEAEEAETLEAADESEADTPDAPTESTDEGTDEGAVLADSTDSEASEASEVSEADPNHPVIEDDVPFEEVAKEDPIAAGNLSAFLPDENEGGESVLQRRPQLHISQKVRAMCFLSEINMDAFYFFCDRNMTAGQSIVIDFLVPQRFLVMAEVVFCRPYNIRSRIISSTPLLFRCAARPLFIKAGERTLLREFLETVEPDVEALAAQQKAKKPIKKKEEEEDLDDLDDLEL